MLKAIKSEQQYKNAMERLYALMQSKWKAGSKQFTEMQILTSLIGVYEMTHPAISR